MLPRRLSYEWNFVCYNNSRFIRNRQNRCYSVSTDRPRMSLAKFQSLSCFTRTGFTTQEAELITINKRRRRIASVLIVLGNGGLVVMIGDIRQNIRWSSGAQNRSVMGA